MSELSTEAKMIIASNLTIAATIRDAALSMRSSSQPDESKDVVTRVFAAIYANLQKQSGEAA
jgi:hypothetical protein